MDNWLRCCDQGALLVQAGRAAEAPEVIPDPDASVWNGMRVDPNPVEGSEGYVQACLSRAEAYEALGDLSAAGRTLCPVLGMLETVGQPQERQRAAALAARLESASSAG